LLRTDAVRLAMEFGVLAATEKWTIISDLPGFSSTGLAAAEASASRGKRETAAATA
jgi:hypothetical protein